MTMHPKPLDAAPDLKLPTYDARALCGAADQAQFVLEDKIYTLRITRAGKLILTK